jgi:NAD(P)-dependent dehydrogenase (short-subunit alcohol dehydrogenase family)
VAWRPTRKRQWRACFGDSGARFVFEAETEVFCSQAAYRIMKEQKSGKIINIGSVAGERGGLFAGAHYSAAKAGLIVLAKCFVLNGGKYNINSNAIAPGLLHICWRRGFMKSDPRPSPCRGWARPSTLQTRFCALHRAPTTSPA